MDWRHSHGSRIQCQDTAAQPEVLVLSDEDQSSFDIWDFVAGFAMSDHLHSCSASSEVADRAGAKGGRGRMSLIQAHALTSDRHQS